MARFNITLPAALAALPVWLALTLGISTWERGGHPQSLAEAAGGGIGLAWVAAALLALIITLAAPDRRTAGLTRPSCLRLTWLPLSFALLMLLLTWAGDFPDTRTTIIIACNTALVALSEELMFRSILLQGMLTRFPLLPSVLASSAIFGVVHAANGFSTGDMQTALWQSLAAALQGVGYAAIRIRTGSVWPMVLIHGLWDFSLMASAISAASQNETSTLPAASLLIVLPLFLYGLYLLRPGAAVTVLRTSSPAPDSPR